MSKLDDLEEQIKNQRKVILYLWRIIDSMQPEGLWGVDSDVQEALDALKEEKP